MPSFSGKHKMPQNKLILYATIGSPPCRTVYITAKALNIELQTVEIDTSKGDTQTPEFLKVFYEIYINLL